MSSHEKKMFMGASNLIFDPAKDLGNNQTHVSCHDAERQKNPEADGIKFLRFTNKEVERELEAVIRKIQDHIVNHGQIN